MAAQELLEREQPLQVLDAGLAIVSGGSGQIALISGEAGIGKTSIVERFIALHQSRWRVLWGACDSFSTPRPLGPLHDIAAQAGQQQVVIPDAFNNPHSIFTACLHFLQHQPTIVLFEDIHWADEATLDFLKFVARRIRESPVYILLTFRDDEVGPRHPLRPVIGELARMPFTTAIPLGRLSEHAVRSLARRKGVDGDHLYRITNGNPFYVTEVLESAGEIPSTVRDAVMARAARLSPSGWAALEAAAVIGPRVEAWLLAEVIGSEADHSEECIAVGMLQTQGGLLMFRHDLTWQTVFDAVSPHRKLVLNRLVLSALRTSAGERHNLARLASHAEGANDRTAVLEYAPAAARQAAAVNAHREAVAQYERALRFTDGMPREELALMLEAYARECNMTDQREKGIAARLQAIDIWRESNNELKCGENLSLLMVMYFGLGKTQEAEAVSKKAIEVLVRLPPSRELAMAYRTQASIRMFVRDNHEAIAWGNKAIALAEQFNDAETLSGAYNAIGSAWMISDFDAGQSYLEKSLAIARDAGLELQVSNAYNNLGSASGEVYRYDQAEHYLVEGLAHAYEHGYDSPWHYMQAWQALAHLHLGRWDDAGECAIQVLKQPSVSSISRIMALLALGRLRARRGDPGVWEALAEALDLAEQTQTLQRIAPVRAARAEAAWLEGDLFRALAEARACYDLAFSKKHPWFVGELLFWVWRAGGAVSPPEWAAAPFALQITGDWRAAAAAWENVRCPYERASALAYGPPEALWEALRLFEGLGAQPAASRLRQLMIEKGVSGVPRGPRATTRHNPWGLTGRELEVLNLLLEGLANSQIAGRLSLSVRTVEHHLAAIFSKLGVTSRGEAIATASRQPGVNG